MQRCLHCLEPACVSACPTTGAAIATIVTVFCVRLLAIRFNWRTTALYREPTPPA
jgi:nitrate reductase beta subunit